MFDTPYSRKIQKTIMNNAMRYNSNQDLINGEHSGYLLGGSGGPLLCDGCGMALKGGRNKFLDGLKNIGKNILPVVEKAASTVAENPELLTAMMGAGIKNHHYTTKKGDKYHHIGHHDVFEPDAPYTPAIMEGCGMKGGRNKFLDGLKSIGKTLAPIAKKAATTVAENPELLTAMMGAGVKTKVDPMKRRALKNAKNLYDHEEKTLEGGKVKKPRKASGWIEFVKQYSKSHNISYKEAMQSADCKKQYKQS